MPEIQKSGYKRFWELRQLTGRNPDGSKKSVEGYLDMTTNEFYAPENGWNGRPPELPSGERLPETSSKYAKNYDLIDWSKNNAAKECKL